MGASKVQAKKSSSASASTLAVAFTSNVTAGNLLCCVAADGGNGTMSVSDNRNGAWTGVDAQLDTGGAEGLRLFYFKNAASGATTVTLNPTTTESVFLAIFEVSGADTTAPLTANHNTHTSATSPNSGAAFTPAAGSFLLQGFMDDNNDNVSITPGSPWLDDSAALTAIASGRGSGSYQDNVAASSTTPRYSFGTNFPSGIAWAEFKAASAAAFAIPHMDAGQQSEAGTCY